MANIKLSIAENETILAFQSTVISLPIGTSNIDGYRLKNSPVTPYEAEMAIEHIENIIIPARKKIPFEEITISCSDEPLNNILAGKASFLPTSQIESAFNELANVINGSPSNSTSLPLDKSFTAFLLIIREITHHWGVDGITIELID